MRSYLCAMKRILLLILALAFLLKPVFPVVDYVIRYDFIANELCVNKDKSNLECNGKCYLKKGLADAAGQTDKKLPEKQKQTEFELFFMDLPQWQDHFVPAQAPVTSTYKNLYGYDSPHNVFHPPAIC